MKIVVIDNYDSFVYNLVHYLEELNCEVTVYRNDAFKIEDLKVFDKIVLSPGPGIPDEAGLLKEVIETYKGKKPIFGVCLGQQAIGEVFGGKLINLKKVFHGVATQARILDTKEPLFKGLDDSLAIGRYHSWVIAREDFPQDLIITSIDENEQIMSIRHKEYDICGVQFHPESVLTPSGKTIVKNWIKS